MLTEIFKRIKTITPMGVGLFVGILATTAQALFGVSPPPAYGICIACHTRDLVNWTVNNLFKTQLGLAPISKVLPLMTPLGILIGALVSAVQGREFKIRTTINPIFEFILGMLIMIFALTLGACPMRTVLRVAYGDLTAFIGFLSIASGVVVGSIFLRWSVRI